MEITLRSKFGLWNQININWQIYFQKFFWVASCFIKQGWAHSHNFENLVQLVSESGCKEIQMHLLTSPKNATYLSPAYLAKYTSIMNEYTEVLLLKSLIKGHFYSLQWRNKGHIYNWTASHLINFWTQKQDLRALPWYYSNESVSG